MMIYFRLQLQKFWSHGLKTDLYVLLWTFSLGLPVRQPSIHFLNLIPWERGYTKTAQRLMYEFKRKKEAALKIIQHDCAH